MKIIRNDMLCIILRYVWIDIQVIYRHKCSFYVFQYIVLIIIANISAAINLHSLI